MKKLLAVCTTALQALGLARGGNSAPRHAHNRVRFTKPLAVITTAILATGLAVVGVAAPASAHNQSVTSTCSAVTVNLTNYSKTVPATETTYKTIPNPDYVPESTVTSYQRYSWNGGNQSTTPTEVPPSDNWQPNTANYHKNDPVNTAFIGNNGNWFYWLKTVTVTPAVGSPTIQVVDHQGTPQKTNHVTVTIDGAATPVADVDFSESYNNTFTFANSTQSHSWKIVVTAWDDPAGYNHWTKTMTGSSTACAAPTFNVSQCTGPGQSSQGSYYIPSTSGVKYYVKVNGGSYAPKTSNTTYNANFGDVVTVQARSSDGNTVFVTYPSVTFANPGACATTVTPVGPTVTDAPACGGYGTVTLATTTGVKYVLTSFDQQSGDWVVTATPLPNYKFAGDQTVTFTGNVGASVACPTVVTPVTPNVTQAPVCGGYGTVTPVTTVGVTYVVTSFDQQTGAWVVTATPASSAYKFAGDQTVTFTGNAGAFVACPTVVTPVDPAVTQAPVCGGYGTVTPVTTVGVTYVVTSFDQQTGAWVVTATPASSAYKFAGDQTVTFTGNAGAFVECPTPLTIETDPEVVQPQCVVGDTTTLVSGYITVAVTDHVTYSITGTTDDNTAVSLTDVGAKTDLAPGHYTVTATADAGFVLAGDHVGPWEKTITAYDGVCGQIPTHAQIETAVTSSNQVCTAGVASGGTITVAQVEGEGGMFNNFDAGVSYFINGTKVTSITTAVAAGTYKVTATVDDPADVIQEGDASEWTITIAAPSTDCAQLKTLAFTGADGSMGGMLIFALFLLLGGAGVYTASRFRSRES